MVAGVSLAGWLGAGGVALLGGLWALWERVRRVRAEGEAKAWRKDSLELAAKLKTAEAARIDAIRRREHVIEALNAELERMDASLRPVAGDVVERLRSRLRPPPDDAP